MDPQVSKITDTMGTTFCVLPGDAEKMDIEGNGNATEQKDLVGW